MSNLVIRQILRQGRRQPRKYVKAALETGAVESGFRNLHGGDADSAGWRQERRSLYPNPRNVKASVRRFYSEAAQHDAPGKPAWLLAADVQRPAQQYRTRYRDARGTADAILHGRRTGGKASVLGYRPATFGAHVQTGFDKQGFKQAERRALVGQFLQNTGHFGVLFRTGALTTTTPNRADFTTRSLKSNVTPGRFTTTPGMPDLIRPHGGKVRVAPTANLPGKSIKHPVIRFVREVAGMVGHPLTIGTGTNHSRLTINGTVSDHFSGNAADVPLTGSALVRAGQDALIAAGMPAKKARRITGGGFTLYKGGHRIQVIFNTNAPGWGNHLTHLHVGVAPR